MADRKNKTKSRELVLGYVEKISSKVFSEYPKEITALAAKRHGVYALYKGHRLYYVGLASNLKNRVRHHLQDKHSGKWDKFSLYLVRKSDHIRELESLILRIADPQGNAVKGRLPHAENLKAELRSHINKAHKKIISEVLGVRKKKVASKKLNKAKPTGEPTLAPYVNERFGIRCQYKGKTYKATVRKEGTIQYNGTVFNSPSLAGHAITGRAINGWGFWRFKNSDGEWIKLNELRK